MILILCGLFAAAPPLAFREQGTLTEPADALVTTPCIDMFNSRSQWNRVGQFTQGAAQITAAAAVAATYYYVATYMVAATVAWLLSPAGTTACIGYVCETQGSAVAMPLIYATAAKSATAPVDAVVAAGAIAAKTYTPHAVAGMTVTGVTGGWGYAAKAALFPLTSSWSGLRNMYQAICV